MKRATAFLLCSVVVAIVFSLLIVPAPKVQHSGSSAFQAALGQAVDRLENGGKTILDRTATPVAAAAAFVTYESGYTCDASTCDTYDALKYTCDRIDPLCVGGGVHTFEPPPYNHTCEGYTCDGAHTCDLTADPRAETCDAGASECCMPTFAAICITCNPLKQECRQNNPKGFCTAVNYPTCDGQSYTCDGQAGCTNPTERTSWGKIKNNYAE